MRVGDWTIMPDFKFEKALVLSTRRLGERSVVISLFTKENGRHLGVLQKKSFPEIGSFVEGRWQARLPEQLGTFYLEQSHAFFAPFLDDSRRLACLSTVCALIDSILPERQSYRRFYDLTLTFLNLLDTDDFLKYYVRWEMDLLQMIGFGLDCSGCAGGGNGDDLAYISPKTGRAVSKEKGEPYKDKLLPLPAFLWQETDATMPQLRQGLNLTGYFLSTHAGIKALPKTREQLYKDPTR